MQGKIFRRRDVAAKGSERRAMTVFPEGFEKDWMPQVCASLVSGVVSAMTKLLKRFAADESGATAIEYGLIAAGISVAIITVVQGLGTKLNTVFGNIKNKL